MAEDRFGKGPNPGRSAINRRWAKQLYETSTPNFAKATREFVTANRTAVLDGIPTNKRRQPVQRLGSTF